MNEDLVVIKIHIPVSNRQAKEQSILSEGNCVSQSTRALGPSGIPFREWPGKDKNCILGNKAVKNNLIPLNCILKNGYMVNFTMYILQFFKVS